jgi:hypothetical protein
MLRVGSKVFAELVVGGQEFGAATAVIVEQFAVLPRADGIAKLARYVNGLVVLHEIQQSREHTVAVPAVFVLLHRPRRWLIHCLLHGLLRRH